MADTDPVRIVVEVVNQTKDDLEEIRKDLEQLDRKNVDPDVDVDDDGDIESIRAQLEALRKSVESNVDVDLRGIASAEAQLDLLARDRTVDIDTDTDNLFGDFDAQRGVNEAVRGNLERLIQDDMSAGFLGGTGRRFEPFDLEGTLPEEARQLAPQQALNDPRVGMQIEDAIGIEGRRRGDFDIMDGPRFPGFPDVDMGDDGRALGLPDGVQRWAQESADDFRNLGRTLNKLRPNIMTIWNALATLIPILFTLGAAVVGLAGAFATLGVAAVAILGVGLLGWGDSMSDTLQQLQQDARMLAERLFEIAQPAADTFQPIAEDFLAGVPAQVQRLVEPLQQFEQFAGVLADLGQGFVGWIIEATNAMVALREESSQLARRFSAILGNLLIDFMSDMVAFTYENQEAVIALGAALADAVTVLFRVFYAVSVLFSALEPLTDLIAAASSILSNSFVIALLSAVAGLLVAEGALTAAILALAALEKGLIATAISVAARYIPTVLQAALATWQWVTAVNGLNAALRGLLALTGIGLIFAGGSLAAQHALQSTQGPRTSGGGGGGSVGGNTYINVEGNVERRQMNKILDKMPETARNEDDIGAATRP